MGSIHLVGGEKGGVGKSFTARLLAQYFIDNQQPFIGFDTDQSHGTFTRFYREFTSSIDTRSFDSLDTIIASAESSPDTHIIVDLAAQTLTSLTRWIEDSDIFGVLQELGFTLYLWHVMDDGADSMNLLQKVMETYDGDAIRLILVENLGRGDCFEYLEGSDIYARALENNAQVLKLDQLQPGLVKKVDFSNTSFWAAANNRQLMSTVERHRVATWLKKQYVQFDRILLPAVTEAANADLMEPSLVD